MMFHCKFMAPSIFFMVLCLPLIPSCGSLQSHEEGFISVVVSERGLEYAKDLLVEKAISSIVLLQLPQIRKTVKVPFIGHVQINLSNITIDDVQVTSSYVRTGEKGIVLAATGATANLTMMWKYSYSSWLVPIAVSDSGSASIKVEGMQVGLTVDLKNQEGALKLVILDCGCYVGDLSIKLDGGASWLYQRIVNVFGAQIASAVEDGISNKLIEGISNLDKSLQSLPKQMSVDNTAWLDVSFVDNPVFSNYYVGFEINGLFTGRNEISEHQHFHRGSEISVSCGGFSKMIKISLHEKVFQSASLVYFNADYMQWIVDEIPDQALLNTAGWRYIVPQLYRQYPNDDMNLDISVSSPPIIQVSNQAVDTMVILDVIIDVLEAGEVIPVACISMEIRASGAVEIVRNNISGNLILKEFSTYLKWSRIGKLHMGLVKAVMSVLIRTVFLPYVNLHLRRGFPLPLLHGFTLQNAHIFYSDTWVTVCSDVSFFGHQNFSQQPAYVSY